MRKTLKKTRKRKASKGNNKKLRARKRTYRGGNNIFDIASNTKAYLANGFLGNLSNIGPNYADPTNQVFTKY